MILKRNKTTITNSTNGTKNHRLNNSNESFLRESLSYTSCHNITTVDSTMPTTSTCITSATTTITITPPPQQQTTNNKKNTNTANGSWHARQFGENLCVDVVTNVQLWAFLSIPPHHLAPLTTTLLLRRSLAWMFWNQKTKQNLLKFSHFVQNLSQLVRL